MKTSLSTLGSLAFALGIAHAAPAANVKRTPQTDFPPPPGGFESITYPAGTGENLPSYPAPPGGYESVNYPPGTGASDACVGIIPSPFQFSSVYFVTAVGSEVINATGPTPGPPDALGFFNYGINVALETICFNITLLNVRGTYQSPALTATHIHQGARGAAGPPRIAFPNPVGDDLVRRSVGCLTGPFTTGIMMNGMDTGAGFKLAQIEANPAGFFTDSHTNLFVPGVVRGQLG
ncbi:hypothetical protein MMC24_001303 [Lignoscripta atroalba]|nr:hypothetical protein [Lignoscripta atroalba]